MIMLVNVEAMIMLNWVNLLMGGPDSTSWNVPTLKPNSSRLVISAFSVSSLRTQRLPLLVSLQIANDPFGNEALQSSLKETHRNE